MFLELRLSPKVINVDNKLCRGSAPINPRSLLKMKEQGINQVIDLRNSACLLSFMEKLFCKILGLNYVNFKYPHRLDYVPPHDFFQKINEKITKNEGKTYIHCHYGKRRTGICVAIYEKEHTKKTKKDILKELIELGFKEVLSSGKSKKQVKLQKIYNDFLKKYFDVQN